MEEVILDFSKTDYSDADVLDEKSLIHRSKMADFMCMFEKQLELAKNEMARWDDGKRKVRNKHDAITVYASRGAGKSSFLLTAKDRVEKNYGKDILCLEPQDPSLIETKQHPFINIIASIHERVKDTIEAQYVSMDEIDRSRIKKFEKSYSELVKALPFIEGIGKKGMYEDWDDYEYVAMQGMEKAIASNNLEKAFQQYIYDALKCMRKTCVLISFDDIDTDFQKGFQILEIVRKYLTTPFVITILTGDLELYGKLVRRESWKCFDPQFLGKETGFAKRKKNEFSTLINQLENQYLVKILKPENRIQICTMREYISKDQINVNVKFSGQEKAISIVNCYDKLIKTLGCRRENGKVNELVQFLLGLSIRIQIRLLTLMNNQKIMESDGRVSDLANGVMDVFWNDINQKADNAKALSISSPVYTIEMLKFLVYTDMMYQGLNFLPETNDDIQNKALFAIGIKYNDLVRSNRKLIFDYWIRLSYVGAMTELICNEKQGVPTNVSMKDFLKFTAFNADAGLTKSVGLSQAFYNYALKKQGKRTDSMAGTIQIDSFPPASYSSEVYRLAMMALFGTTDVSRRHIVYLSIFRLLAVISEVMCEDSEFGKSQTLKQISTNLMKLGQYRFFMEPSNETGIEDSKGEDDSDEYINRHLGAELDYFYNIADDMVIRILRWSKSGSFDSSCQLLNRIFTRFYYTLINVSYQNELYSPAELFSRFIVALLNSALVEESIERNITGVNYSNDGDIEDVFAENIFHMKDYCKQNHVEEDRLFGFFLWLSKCPLLQTFYTPFVDDIVKNIKLYENDFMKAWYIYHAYAKKKKRIDAKIYNNDKLQEKFNDFNVQLNGLYEFVEISADLGDYEQMRKHRLNSESFIQDISKIIEQLRRRFKEYQLKTPSVVSIDALDIYVTRNSSKAEVGNARNKLSERIFMLTQERKIMNNEKDNIEKARAMNIANFVAKEYDSKFEQYERNTCAYDALTAMYSKREI